MTSVPFWKIRKFKFELPVEMYPNLLERLRGTPARLEDKIASLPKEILTAKDGDGWSIQEQVGHLADLYELWDGRLDDYDNNLDELRPADITNRVTSKADHNHADIDELLHRFRANREKLVARFDKIESGRIGQSAFHARLGVQMRIIDHALFIAEHDDHHLATMTAMLK